MKERIENITEIIRSYDLKTMNFRLIIYCFILSIIGILAINSAASEDYVKKQIFGLCLGLIVMFFFSLVKYEYISRYYWLLYLINILCLLAVNFFGTSISGAKRWIFIGGLQIQPSELSKLFLLIFISALLASNRQSLNSLKFLIFAIITFAVPIALIMLEPDLSTSIVIITMFCVIIFIGKFHFKVIKNVLLVVLPILAVIIALIIILPADKNILPVYQYNRLVGFFDSENEEAEKIRYQQENSVIAIAGGSVSGKGLNNNSITSVKNAEFISEPHTDFIFTIVGEELGFLGSMAVIILISLIVIECFRIGLRARENIGRCIAIGYGSLIGMQAFINLGVVTMILPNTGLTLPFVSYGLSSLITSFLGIGIVLNIGLRKKIVV